MLNKILLGDCYELMKGIPDGSIDLVLTDPPYNTTACNWDKQPIDLPELWKHLKRVLKPKGAVVMTGSQPFTTDLIMSNRAWFKYELIWNKTVGSSPGLAKYRPLPVHENILIFGKGNKTYHAQMSKGFKSYVRKTPINSAYKNEHKFGYKIIPVRHGSEERYPISVITMVQSKGSGLQLHPTQKPIALFEYLIRTYTNENETILDPFCGSGTTALAAHATGRQFICFEKEPKYFEIANKRLALAQMQGRFEEMVG